jgi:dynein cytoplasmic 1 light intermediate chain
MSYDSKHDSTASPDGVHISVGTDSASTETKKTDQNVWHDLLQKYTKTASDVNGNVFVLGDGQNGKGFLLRKLRDRQFNQKSREYLVDYSYCNVKNYHDEDEPDEVRGRLNIWEFDDPEHSQGLLPRFLRTHGLKESLIVLTIDLSQPWSIMKSLQTWMDVLNEAIAATTKDIDDVTRQELRERISSHNQRFIDPSRQKVGASGPEQHIDDDAIVDYSIPTKNIGIPLVIVGCKADALGTVFQTQTGVGDRFHFINKRLREFALEYGAALMFTSSVGGGTNVEALQDYIYHRLFNFDLRQHAQPEGTETEFGVYIPAGFDSTELVNSVTPATADWESDAKFSFVFRNPEKVTKSNSVAINVQQETKADDNQLFFKSLKFKLDNPTGRRASPSVDTVMRSKPTTRPSKRASITGAAGANSQDNAKVKEFFKSLLNKSGTAGGTRTRAAKSTVERPRAGTKK